MATPQDPSFPLPYRERHLPFDERKGKKVWPNGARMAFFTYIALEEWDWGATRPQVPMALRPIDGIQRPLLNHRSAVKYGFDVGVRRLRDILKELDLRITLWTTGNAAEQHPDVVKELSDLGHEVSGHSYNEGTSFPTLNREQQQADIRKSVELIQKLTGKKPVGWIGPGANCDENTVELLAQEGFLYHADLQDDELPYFIDVNGKTLVEIPYRMVGNINDLFMFGMEQRSAVDALAFVKQAFDAYYREAAVRPLQFNFGTHPYVSGRPEAAWVYSEFLKYVKKYPDVWMATYKEIAEYWKQRFNMGYNFA